VLTAIDRAPEACEEVRGGKRLAAVGVSLSRAEPELLKQLLEEAWELKAPKRLARDEPGET
jgi:hypothetical protein